MTDPHDTDRRLTTCPGLTRAYARALTLSNVTTATTRDKTFSKRQICICLHSTPRRTTSTPDRACPDARATRDSKVGRAGFCGPLT